MKELIERTVDKRERILLAAVEVFTRKGYGEARIEDIAEIAGIGKGTLYEYYDSKRQLFYEMISRSWEEYTSLFRADFNKGLSFEETIWTIIKGHFAFSKRKRKMARIVFWDTEIMDDELKVLMEKQRERKKVLIEKAVRQAIESEEIKPVESMLVYTILAGLIGSIWTISVLDDWEIDPEALADQLTDVVMNGIRRR